MIRYIDNIDDKEKICRNILSQLPEWFGKKDGITQYIKESRVSHFWADIESDNPIGFIMMKENSPHTVEISVMGVLKEYQRKGIGAELFKSFYDFAKNNNYDFIQVKTVRSGKYASYDITNSFYKRIGFKELECIENLWDKDNPCQIYIMSIS
ncbi:MAG: GNAT family N-acetyltransferase [Candidatus Fimenecus sp.]